MKKIILFTLLLGICVLWPLYGKNITISKSVLMDKIKGGWAGQVIGCTYGGPTEFVYRETMIGDNIKLRWDDEMVKEYFKNQPGLYDDIYMDLTFVQVFEEKGLNATIKDFANTFARAGYPLWHANQSARYNILQGMTPPASGHWRNNPHADDLDFQIEADYAGLMAPAMPRAALHYGDSIGHIMCYGDGWYGGVYVSTMYSLAFIHNDIQKVVCEGLKAIPRKSLFYKCMSDVIKWYKEHPTDWKATWQLLQEKWGNSEGCPEGVFEKLNIDTKINCAYVIMGLLYGNGNYGKTIDIATRCGQDSDCNPSTAAGILGTLIGYEKIPTTWKNCLPAIENECFAYTNISLKKAYELSYKHALEVVKLNGGKVYDQEVRIKKQPVKTARFEQSFEGIKVKSNINLHHKKMDETGEIRFNGCGIVVRGYLNSNDKNYVGLVEVWIDGKKMSVMKMPASFHSRSNDIYWNFELEEGDHRMNLKLLNPKDNIQSVVSNIMVYQKDK